MTQLPQGLLRERSGQEPHRQLQQSQDSVSRVEQPGVAQAAAEAAASYLASQARHNPSWLLPVLLPRPITTLAAVFLVVGHLCVSAVATLPWVESRKREGGQQHPTPRDASRAKKQRLQIPAAPRKRPAPSRTPPSPTTPPPPSTAASKAHAALPSPSPSPVASAASRLHTSPTCAPRGGGSRGKGQHRAPATTGTRTRAGTAAPDPADAFVAAARSGDVRALKLLVPSMPDLKACLGRLRAKGYVAKAVKAQQWDALRYILIKLGMEPELSDLLYAMRSHSPFGACQILVESGAQDRDYDHQALRTTAQIGRQDLVQMLLVGGHPDFRVCVTPDRFSAATSAAAGSGHLGLVEYLVRMMQGNCRQGCLSHQDIKKVCDKAVHAASSAHLKCTKQPLQPEQQGCKGDALLPQPQQRQCSHLAVISYLKQQASRGPMPTCRAGSTVK